MHVGQTQDGKAARRGGVPCCFVWGCERNAAGAVPLRGGWNVSKQKGRASTGCAPHVTSQLISWPPPPPFCCCRRRRVSVSAPPPAVSQALTTPPPAACARARAPPRARALAARPGPRRRRPGPSAAAPRADGALGGRRAAGRAGAELPHPRGARPPAPPVHCPAQR